MTTVSPIARKRLLEPIYLLGVWMWLKEFQVTLQETTPCQFSWPMAQCRRCSLSKWSTCQLACFTASLQLAMLQRSIPFDAQGQTRSRWVSEPFCTISKQLEMNSREKRCSIFSGFLFLLKQKGKPRIPRRHPMRQCPSWRRQEHRTGKTAKLRLWPKVWGQGHMIFI